MSMSLPNTQTTVMFWSLSGKRAQASAGAVDQVLRYTNALAGQPEFVGRRLFGVLIAERIPDQIRKYAKEHDVQAYEVSWPLTLSRVA